MTLAPPRPPTPDEPDALIREARLRQKRRLLGGVLVVLAVGLSIYAIIPGGRPHTRQGRGGSQAAGSFQRCRSDQLRLTGPIGNGAYTGHSVQNFTFTNVSSRSCSLRGWPTVAAVVGSRVILETPKGARGRNGAIRTGRLLPVRTVVLRPQGKAAFNVVAIDPFMLDHAPCVRSSAELVTPPGGNVPLRVEVAPNRRPYWPGYYCGLRLGVTSLVSGRIDRYLAG